MQAYEEQGLELAKEGVKELLAPVSDVLRALVGPAAEEIGLSLGESARLWRVKRSIKILEKVKTISAQSGLELRPVALRLLFPIVQSASLEDDESLQDKWAALLANASTSPGTVLPAFPRILEQLSPREAALLEELAGANNWWAPTDQNVVWAENLQRLGLLEKVKPLPIRVNNEPMGPQEDLFQLNALGHAFLTACHPPAAKQSSQIVERE
jgi:Abortive infection alpha